MARVTVLPNGVTASFPRFGPQAEKSPRGKVKGWSPQSAARLRRWFYSVDGARLDGLGVGATLTVRDLPPTSADWTLTRERFMVRLRRAGLLRGQWLTEWQRRGVPHLHGCLYFPEGARDGLQELVTGHWQAAAGEWGVSASGQHVAEVWGLPGWLQYQAKHSSRGVRHYQRANVPAAWRESTGRLWGVVGEWPVREEVREVTSREFWRFRRLLRAWLVSEARRDGDRRRAAYLRHMLSDPDKKRSAVRAIGEFCPERVALELLAAATWGTMGDAVLMAEGPTDRPEAPQERRAVVAVDFV